MVGEAKARVASGECEEEAGEGAACARARGSVTRARGAAVGDARLLLSRAGAFSRSLQRSLNSQARNEHFAIARHSHWIRMQSRARKYNTVVPHTSSSLVEYFGTRLVAGVSIVLLVN
jgi:hypothetical protein